MGLSSSTQTSKSKTRYGAPALPHINAATGALDTAFAQAQPNLNTVTDALGKTFAGYQTVNPNLTAANSYVGDVLGGKFMEGNPYLQGMIDQTNDSVMDRVNALFSRAGQTGSSRQIGELGKQLSDAELRLRYGNYTDEQNRMGAAVQQAAGLNAQENANIQTQGALGTLWTGLPLDVASQYAQGQAGLWGNILDSKGTQKTSGGIGQMIGGLAGAALGGWASGGFK